MSTADELKDWAVEVIQNLLEDIEFSEVYENEDIPEEDWKVVYELATSAQVWMSFPDNPVEAFQVAGESIQ